jgi:S-adenosylmethionine:tRNA ribosyltransferase-isomerase
VSKSLKPGRFVHLESVDGNDSLKVLGREGEFYRLEFPSLVVNVLERHGQTPLPPYIRRAADEEDRNRYQTVYSRHPGAVAAPTAGLHFTKQLLERIAEQGATLAKLTLHVGAGTFQSVRVSNLEQHKMHSERYFISEATAQAVMNTRRDGGRVIAVGTTVVRALESARQRSVGEDLATGWAETNLFITPGYEFGCVDALVTNFHLPESSLLMLVCAFAGYDRVMRAYHLAVEQQYRFFSYGDAMFLRAACSRQEST